jgi:branched-chain amino acid transport system ATP-binding protein/branched-chain amino acid transport system permease protein
MSETATRPDEAAAPAPLPRWRTLAGETLLGGRWSLLFPLIGAVVLLLFPVYSSDQYWLNQLSLIAVLFLVISGVNLSFGYAGEVQFGQVFMFALGSYATMILAVSDNFVEIIPLVIIGGLVAAIAGFVIALPALRIGGWSLAMASFFLVITLPDFVRIFQSKTGGDNGLIGIPSPKLFGTTLGTKGLYVATVAVALLWLVCYRNLVTSRYGVIFRILRESPVQARSLGFSTLRLKVLAYTLGALPAGIAGCLYGFISLIITPSDFGINLAIGIVAASVLGGVESVYGAILGAAILQLGPEESVSFAQYAPVVYGGFLIAAAVLLRSGVGGLGRLAAVRASRRLVGKAPEGAAVTAAGSLSAHSAHAEEVATDHHALIEVLGKLAGRALDVRGVSKAFGGVKALRDVTLNAEPGRITALIGSNGSGKTTLLNVICGYTRADSGSVVFDEPLTGMSAHRVAKQRVGRTFQTPSIPRGVSVADVVASGRFHVDQRGVLTCILRLRHYRRSRRADRVEALEMLDLVGLAAIADQEASSQPLGNRRLIELARALCGRPSLLLLDEPASGLGEHEVETLGRVVTAAARAGATVVLIEHNFGFVGRISDQVHVLHLGELIASGQAAEVSANPRVIESYLGESEAPGAAKPEIGAARTATRGAGQPATAQANGAAALLEVRDLESGYGDLQVLRGVSVSLRQGTVEVILGRNGVGKTTLLSTICGQLRLWNGAITLEGRDISRQPAYRRAASGIALVQEGKRIFRNRTIMENVVLGTRTVKLSRAERRALCQSVLEQFPVLRERAGERAGGLSGGQQQMLAIAQALASRPRILLLDEPSAGLAPTIVSELFQWVRTLADEGLSVLLVEQLAQQALKVADHVTVIDDGRVTHAGAPSDFHDLRELQEAYFGAPGDAPGPLPAGATR